MVQNDLRLINRHFKHTKERLKWLIINILATKASYILATKAS